MTTLTAKQKVMAVYPYAVSFNVAPYVCGVYADCYADKPIGVGITEAEAWNTQRPKSRLQRGASSHATRET